MATELNELTGEESNASRGLPAWLSGRIGILLALIGSMWAIEIVDTVVLSDELQSNGLSLIHI